MMRYRWLFLFLLLTAAGSLHGQYTKEFKRIFFDADYLYETEFYEEAFNRYKNLLTLDPGNKNILFLCGACCLNIPGSEELAITYLKEAAEGVSMNYKEHSHKESGAPVFTYYMLGRAYHLHNEFTKAVENYKYYLELGTNQNPLQLEYTRLQIEACSRAAVLLTDRPSFEFQSVLDHFDDDLPPCSNPVISGDGNILIFLVDYPSDKKIMMTKRGDKLWSRPRVINSEIGMVGETYPVCLSYNGKELYLMHQFYSHSDIFISRLEGNRWSEAEALGHQINGRTSETHASISKDGKTLYFTSNPRGGLGSFDIYVSHLDDKGEWEVPTNLGPVINTPYEEHTPFISSNDSILFFSSQGHATIGGIDVFYSEMNRDGTWGEPVNLGYPVNTTGEDLFFNPGWDELDGYYAVRREEDPTSNTINMVIELEPEPEEMAVVSELVESDTEVAIVSEPVEAEADVSDVTEPTESIEDSDFVKEEITTEEVIPTVTMAIEPPETDEIEEVLNRDAEKPVEDQVKKPAEKPTVMPVPVLIAPSDLQTSISFDLNAFELNMAALLEVEKIAVVMDMNPETRVELTGHTDATGSSEFNMLLSLQRADQIAQYLEMRGVNKDRISLDGRGEEAPVARNRYPDGEDAPLGRYLNRQVFVQISGTVSEMVDLAGFYVPASLRPDSGNGDETSLSSFWFTVQLKASFRELDQSHFQDLENITEFICNDKYYRYTLGVYRTFQEASDQLKKMQKIGYEDAFIQTLEWYERATE